MNTPHIAIIVLHYKNLDDTRACLASLEKIDYQHYSVIVVNNDAHEHGDNLKREFPDITLIQNVSNVGFAEGNNVGIRAALKNDRTDAVLILNNDTEVEPGFLSAMTNVRGDMIAARMMQYNDRNNVDNLGVVIMKSGLAFNRLDEKQKLFCPSAGCALYSRKLLEAVAYERDGTQYYFDRTYFAYAEDVDLGFRARLLGFEPGYAQGAIVYHKGSASSSKLSEFAVYNTYRNLMWTQYKNYPASLFLQNIFWIILGWKLIFWGYVFKGRPRIIARAIFDGLAGLSVMKRKRAEIQKKRAIDCRTMRSWFESGLFPKNLL
ncbi:MAG: glycosyltransferase family 2 protein [bacterium]|nr:glycosyltransferase family 2 protein [bacterium]